MSHLGHKRTFRSALAYVRFGPIADIAPNSVGYSSRAGYFARFHTATAVPPRNCSMRPIPNGWAARLLTRKLYLASIPLHQTARAGCAQVRAQFFGTRAALRPDVDPRPAHAAAREPVVNDAWLVARQDGRVLFLQLAIGAERRRIGRASDQLHAPGIGGFGDGRRRTSEKASDLPTRHGVWHLGRASLSSGPLLGGLAGHEGHIGARLARQAAPTGEPVAHPPGPGIVGGRREAEISELASQVVQELRGFGDRFDGVEGIGKTAPARGRRHELRHALRASTAHSRRVEAALLPDQPGEEIDRQIIFRRRRRKGVTDAVDSGRGARWRWGRGLGAFHRMNLTGLTFARLGEAIACDNGRRATGWPRGEKN